MESRPARDGPGPGRWEGVAANLEILEGSGFPASHRQLQQLHGQAWLVLPRPPVIQGPRWLAKTDGGFTSSCCLMSEPTKTQKYSCPSVQGGHQIWKRPSGGSVSQPRGDGGGL